MSEDRKQLAKALVVLALLVIVPLLVMRSDGNPGPGPVALQAVQAQYAQTAVELHYTANTVPVDSSPLPVTMTCQLRRGGGLLVAEQVFTWTLPCVDAYTSAPVMAPITLTWSFSEPLRAGAYEEFCRVEAGGIYGWIEGEPGQDGQGFFMANKWTAGYSCYLPIVIKAGR